MPKRFTDTDKWKKEWYLSLKPLHKLFWQYVVDNCSPAGIWEVSWRLASAQIGTKLHPADIEQVFQKQFIPLDAGRRWFLVDFIPFQYGTLRQTNPAHRNILPVLEKYGFLGSDGCISLPERYLEGASKELQSPYEGAKEKDMDKAMDKEKEKEGCGEGEVHPLLTHAGVRAAWDVFKLERAHRRKPVTPLAATRLLNSLNDLSGGDPVLAQKIIDKSIENGWSGFFELKAFDAQGRRVATPPPPRPVKRVTCEHCHQEMTESQMLSHTGTNCPAWKPLSEETKKAVMGFAHD